MKNLQYIILLALFSSLTFISCDKSSLSSGPEQPLEQKKEQKISAKQMAYKENPYDEQGAMHNEFLDYFITHKDSTKEVNPEKMIDIYAGFYDSKDMEFGDEQIAAHRELFHIYGQMPSIGGPYTEPFCETYPAICNLTTFPLPVSLLDEDNGGTSTERTLQFIRAVKTSENKIMADKKLDDRQKKVLLTKHAVARYSAGYWHNVSAIQKDENGFYNAFQEIDAAYVCGTCDVVGADAAGAAVGVLVGGVGAGPGAGIASGAAVVEKAWDWFWGD